MTRPFDGLRELALRQAQGTGSSTGSGSWPFDGLRELGLRRVRGDFLTESGKRALDQLKTATQIAAKWQIAATTVRAWKISWKPNQPGQGLGLLRAYITAPMV